MYINSQWIDGLLGAVNSIHIIRAWIVEHGVPIRKAFYGTGIDTYFSYWFCHHQGTDNRGRTL